MNQGRYHMPQSGVDRMRASKIRDVSNPLQNETNIRNVSRGKPKGYKIPQGAASNINRRA